MWNTPTYLDYLVTISWNNDVAEKNKDIMRLVNQISYPAAFRLKKNQILFARIAWNKQYKNK